MRHDGSAKIVGKLGVCVGDASQYPLGRVCTRWMRRLQAQGLSQEFGRGWHAFRMMHQHLVQTHPGVSSTSLPFQQDHIVGTVRRLEYN